MGIASREVLENVFTGLTLLTSRPFDIGDEVMFKLGSGQVRWSVSLLSRWELAWRCALPRRFLFLPSIFVHMR